MKFKKILILFMTVLFVTATSASVSDAHWGGGHWGHDGHWGHGGHWGFGFGVPLMVEPWYHDRAYPDYSISKANQLIAIGQEKVRLGRWYINQGYPEKGSVLIDQGRALIARGNAILGRY